MSSDMHIRETKVDKDIQTIHDINDSKEFDASQQGINDRSQARLAVLEKIAETHERRITDIEDFHRSVVERFDQKIQLDAANQVAMEKTMTKAVTTLDNLSSNLEKALSIASEANKLAVKHETIGATIMKVAGFLAAILAGLWAVFKFLIGG